MRWYNIEVNNGAEDKNLKSFLAKNGVKFETSGADHMLHFEILASEADAEKVNNFIDSWEV